MEATDDQHKSLLEVLESKKVDTSVDLYEAALGSGLF
jgi:hypothetical protein